MPGNRYTRLCVHQAWSRFNHPELVNDGPYEPGWLIKVSLADATELDNLMSADEYEAFLAEES